MVSNGQIANQTTFNNAFVSRTVDTSIVGKMDYLNADTLSGATFQNLQRVINSFASYMGGDTASIHNVKPTWGHNDIGASTDDLTVRVNLVTFAFNATTGHSHDGTAGSGGPILASSLSTVVLRGYLVRATNLTGVTGGTKDVSAIMAAKPISSGDAVKGVPVLAPNNKVILRDNTGATQGDILKSSLGDEVYARLTNSGGISGTWTLTFYTNIAGTETAYTGFSGQAVQWYYQQLFNPIVDAPIYNELLSIPSDSATQDVIVATTSLQGKVSLSSATPSAIASAGAAGTANASVANADHTHKGVSSFAISGGTLLYGDATISAGSGITLTLSSQNVAIAAKSDVETAFTFANNQGSAADVTGALLDHTVNKTAKITVAYRRETTTSRANGWADIYCSYDNTNAVWVTAVDVNEHLDASGLTFSMTTAGQLQYTSDNMGGSSYVGASRFKISTFGL